jgi:cytosine/adenosine deaminase-related metal-dependent hydrolase
MADILITNGTVITMDKERRVLDGGAVAIEGSRIAAVGATATLRRTHPAPRVIDATRKVVMPGLIDGHAHAGHGLVKTLGGGRGDLWYQACERIYTVGSTEDYWKAEALLSAVERLKCGTTCGVSYLGGGDDIMRTDAPVYGVRHCEAVRDVGIRNILAAGVCRPPFPRTFARWDGGTRQDAAIDFQRQLETCDALIGQWHGGADGRVRIALTFPVQHPNAAERGEVPVEAVRDQAKAVRDLSRARGVLFTQDGIRRGCLKLAHEALGFLGPDALFSHSVDLTDEEIALCRATGARICHNPSANISIQGRCPVPELLDAGVTVMLGSDGTAPDRGYDMFRHMWQCMHYHRRHFRDTSYLPPGKVLEMATIDGARALGLDGEIGSLEPGKRADVILVDMVKPHLYPMNMPVYRIAYFANGADVDTVLVDGKVLMEGRKVCSVDEVEVLDFAQRECEAMLDRVGLRDLLGFPPKFWGHSRYLV